jgi:HSP20 family molecular chaperone IbpA
MDISELDEAIKEIAKLLGVKVEHIHLEYVGSNLFVTFSTTL